MPNKLRYDTFQKANNKGADQPGQRRRLVCAFVVNKPRILLGSRQGPYINIINKNGLMVRWFAMWYLGMPTPGHTDLPYWFLTFIHKLMKYGKILIDYYVYLKKL